MTLHPFKPAVFSQLAGENWQKITRTVKIIKMLKCIKDGEREVKDVSVLPDVL